MCKALQLKKLMARVRIATPADSHQLFEGRSQSDVTLARHGLFAAAAPRSHRCKWLLQKAF